MTDATDLHYASLLEVSGLIAKRALSPVELTQMMLDRIGKVDGGLNSYLSVTGQSALDEAKIAESEIAGGRHRGPLHGVPIAIKDLFWTKGRALDLRDAGLQGFHLEPGRNDRAPAEDGRGSDPGAAAPARGGLRGASPGARQLHQPVERRLLAGRLVVSVVQEGLIRPMRPEVHE